MKVTKPTIRFSKVEGLYLSDSPLECDTCDRKVECVYCIRNTLLTTNICEVCSYSPNFVYLFKAPCTKVKTIKDIFYNVRK